MAHDKFTDFFEKYCKKCWRFGIFTYLCSRYYLELFKFRKYQQFKTYSYDKEIQMLGMRLYS